MPVNNMHPAPMITFSLWLLSSELGDSFLAQLKQEMSELSALQKTLWGAVVRYFRQLSDIDKSSAGKAQPFVANQAERATHLFWQLCERQAQALLDACNDDIDAKIERQRLRKIFAGYALRVFDQVCPNDSNRQLDAWAQSRPNYHQYLNVE
ncbi:type I-E CRISPR-associated protein Cse1/CasA [Vibrio metschnikovii]|uniref:type I-E CRISPR-associated protein Cse1/CasA n=1 Tax=Vibrio metschnikovii TaxID=28172 RepID=UPI001EED5F21|nr:type I-E CRISPR-associated protein Cse1/CasA [Vibrio metschnikovii]